MQYWDPEKGFYEGDDSGYDYDWDTYFSTDYFGNQTPTDYWYDSADWSFVDSIANDPSEARVEEVMVTNPAAADKLVKGLLSAFGDAAKKSIFKDGDPNKGLNYAGISTLAAGAYQLFGDSGIQTGGYNKPVPVKTAVRQAVDYEPDPNRRPGAAGRRYFSDMTYVPEDGDLTAAQQQAQAQVDAIKAEAPVYAAPQQTATTPYVAPWERGRESFRQASPPPQPAAAQQGGSAPMADIDPQTGGLVGLAQGGQVPSFRGKLETNGFVLPGDVVAHADPAGQANKERGLRALHQQVGVEAIRGPGDAMSDSIPTTIDGQEPARVANGEAYVPRENVARMGGGDVDEGAKRLRDIMNSLRKQRTGSSEQINPDNPKELRAAYGGQVKRFVEGGPVSYGTSQASTLSPWVGDYVTDFLGDAKATAAQPYQAYTGQLTAGPSALESQAFAGASNIADTGYTPTQFTGGIFDTTAAQQYMNPYLSAALDPQMKEMTRQAEIKRMEDAGRLTKAGAFGGGRQAIMESEGARNLLDKQRQALAEGYSTAYDKATGQFNADQGRRMDADKATESSRQYSADFSRQSLADLAGLGKTQRGIEQAGLEADKAQFEEERGWSYQMPQYLKDLLGANLPINASSTTPNQTELSALLSQVGELGTMYTQIDEALKKLGQAS